MLDVMSKAKKDSATKQETPEAKNKEVVSSPKKGKRKRSLTDTLMDTDTPASTSQGKNAFVFSIRPS